MFRLIAIFSFAALLLVLGRVQPGDYKFAQPLHATVTAAAIQAAPVGHPQRDEDGCPPTGQHCLSGSCGYASCSPGAAVIADETALKINDDAAAFPPISDRSVHLTPLEARSSGSQASRLTGRSGAARPRHRSRLATEDWQRENRAKTLLSSRQ